MHDLEHLCAFHREIFGDIYPWAGEIRVVGIAKSDPFCLPQHIETYSGEVFDSLAKERFLRGLVRAVNAIQPFREGNRRTQRAFVRQLVEEAGRRLTGVQVFQGYSTQPQCGGLMLDFDGVRLVIGTLADEWVLAEGDVPDSVAGYWTLQ